MDFQFPAVDLHLTTPMRMGVVKRVGKMRRKTTRFKDWPRIFSVRPFSSLRDEVVYKLRSEKVSVR